MSECNCTVKYKCVACRMSEVREHERKAKELIEIVTWFATTVFVMALLIWGFS